MSGDELSIDINPLPLRIGDSVKLKISSIYSQKVNLKLLDISGKPIVEKDYLIDDGENNLMLDIPYLSPGNYELVCSTEKSSASSRVTVLN